MKPITGTFHDWFSLGLTIVDALDTIYIMGLTEGKAINLGLLTRRRLGVFHRIRTVKGSACSHLGAELHKIVNRNTVDKLYSYFSDMCRTNRRNVKRFRKIRHQKQINILS